MKRAKHFFYSLMGKRYLERWRNFLKIPQSQIRIALYLIHHNNKATKQELINNLREIGGDPRSSETIERMIRYMKSDGILEEDNGLLMLKNPKQYQFVIRWIRGNILDRWVAISIPISILAFIFSFLDLTICQFLLILTVIIIILWTIDEALHLQYW